MPTEIQKLIVVALIRDDEGRILLQKRRDAKIPAADGKWELPGGRVEFGESPADAAVRETQEEVGCDIEIIRLLPIVQNRIWERTDDVRLHSFVICYEAKLISGEPQPLDDKVSEVRWFLDDEIKTLDLLVGIKEFEEFSRHEGEK